MPVPCNGVCWKTAWRLGTNGFRPCGHNDGDRTAVTHVQAFSPRSKITRGLWRAPRNICSSKYVRRTWHRVIEGEDTYSPPLYRLRDPAQSPKPNTLECSMDCRGHVLPSNDQCNFNTTWFCLPMQCVADCSVTLRLAAHVFVVTGVFSAGLSWSPIGNYHSERREMREGWGASTERARLEHVIWGPLHSKLPNFTCEKVYTLCSRRNTCPPICGDKSAKS